MTQKTAKEKSVPDPLTKRLDALIRLFIEMNKPKGKEKFNEGVAARLLRSMDFSPTEIAKILGKKSATDVSKYLYGKKAADETTDEEKADVIQNAEKPVAKKENNKSELQGGIAVNE